MVIPNTKEVNVSYRMYFNLPDGRSISYYGGCPYIFFIYCLYHLTYLRYHFNGLSTLVVCWSSAFIRGIIYKCSNVSPFDYKAFAVNRKAGIV